MKLTHPTFERMLTVDDTNVTILTVENPIQLSSYLIELKRQVDGENGSFCLFDEKGELQLSNSAELILDPFSLDINSKRIMNGVTSCMGTELKSERFYEKANDVLGAIEKLLDEVLFYIDTGLRCSEPSIQQLVKSISLYFEKEDSSLSKFITDYLDIASRYAGVKVFILVNLRTYLSVEDYEAVCKEITYRKLNVLLIESKTREDFYSARETIIDQDLCEISKCQSDSHGGNIYY